MGKGMPSEWKWFKEIWNFECKQSIDDGHETKLERHKDLESDSGKPYKIPRGFCKLRKRKSEEETNRNIRSSTEDLNITNDPLLPILRSLETRTTAESKCTSEEPIEAASSEELQSHTRGKWCLPNL